MDVPARRYRQNRQDEIDSASMYRAMAAGERDERLAGVYRRLAETEERHAAFWEGQLRDAGLPVHPPRPSWRARILAAMAQRFGARVILPTVAAGEQANQAMYDDQAETQGTSMRSDERSHARLLRHMVASPGLGMSGGGIARLEGRHPAVGGNALRAAVLGANDGLVSNLSLVMAVSGAALQQETIVITGLAGLLAGAVSMAMGEWVSVKSSRELAERQLGVEAAEISELPHEEREELNLIFQAKGLPEAQAAQVAARIMADERTALDVMAREELGIDPDELSGSPWVAAGASFALFAVGAIVPVLPFVLAPLPIAVGISIAVSGAGLFAFGAAITLFTGRPVWIAGGRQVAFGLGAAAFTFALGRVLGVAIA